MFEPILFPEVPEGFPIPLFPDDVPYDVAVRAFYGTSFSPERRGKCEQADFMNHLIAVGQAMQALAPDRPDEVTEEMTRYKAGYLAKTLALLSAKSRCMSSMITGPANFPVARNQKRLDAEHRRLEELLEFDKKAQAAMRRRLSPPVVEVSLPEQIAALEKQRDLMKSLNAEYRKVKGNIDAMTIPSEKLRETMKATRENYWLGSAKYVPFESFELTSINGKIKRLQQNLVAEERRSVAVEREVVVGEVRIVDNPAADRLQLFYSEKPDRGLINSLKAAGLRWTPSIGAWQAYRTSNGFASVARVLGVEDLRSLLRGAP